MTNLNVESGAPARDEVVAEAEVVVAAEAEAEEAGLKVDLAFFRKAKPGTISPKERKMRSLASEMNGRPSSLTRTL